MTIARTGLPLVLSSLALAGLACRERSRESTTTESDPLGALVDASLHDNLGVSASAARARLAASASVQAAPIPSAVVSAPNGRDARAAWTSVGTATMKLLDSGQPPRRKLRYAWRLDQKELLAMDLRTAASTETGGAKQPEVPLPTVHVALAIDPESVSSEGALRYGWHVVRATVDANTETPSQVADGMRAEVAEIAELSGSASVTSRGLTRDVRVDVGPAAQGSGSGQMVEQVRQTLRDIAAPLPEEDVGVGARWRKLSQLDARNARISQTETFQLVDLQSDGGSLDDMLAQTAPPQTLRAPGMPPGTHARMESMLASGDAKVSFDLSRLVPQTTFDGTTTMVLSGQPGLPGDGTRGATNLTMVMHVFIAIVGSRR